MEQEIVMKELLEMLEPDILKLKFCFLFTDLSQGFRMFLVTFALRLSICE